MLQNDVIHVGAEEGLDLTQVSDSQWEGFYKPLWLASAFLNSGYSYFWDLERDWEIQAFTARSGNNLLCVCQAFTRRNHH